MDMMAPETVLGSVLDLVGAILWLLAVVVLAVVLLVKGGKPRLGGLRLVGGAMILYAVAGLLGDVLTLRRIVEFLYYSLDYALADILFGVGTVVSAVVDSGVLALVVLGLVKVAGDLADGG